MADALYSYLSAVVCVLFWRGVWVLWDWRLAPRVAAAPDYILASDGCVSHAAGFAVLCVLGALRNLVAAPMVISSDASPPIFGAGVTAGLHALNPLQRLRQPPVVQSREEWHRIVGLPYDPVFGTPGELAAAPSAAAAAPIPATAQCQQ